ncbi:hypothetical protein [Lactococcus termiticola]|uniref:Uncharacterized protein n=1 Tax=Lactococcus termiticola TaxID=2169526 RepID=A0A2R5HHF6_9LACT|nr:hypothetical protein [Lactococcus termiticola]GBG97444.1 hypothetical protein NtB2_01589 [Lactococcus termiticola]
MGLFDRFKKSEQKEVVEEENSVKELTDDEAYELIQKQHHDHTDIDYNLLGSYKAYTYYGKNLWDLVKIGREDFTDKEIADFLSSTVYWLHPDNIEEENIGWEEWLFNEEYHSALSILDEKILMNMLWELGDWLDDEAHELFVEIHKNNTEINWERYGAWDSTTYFGKNIKELLDIARQEDTEEEIIDFLENTIYWLHPNIIDKEGYEGWKTWVFDPDPMALSLFEQKILQNMLWELGGAYDDEIITKEADLLYPD